MNNFLENYCAYPFVQVSINPVGKWKLCCVDDDGDDIPTDKVTDFPGGKNFPSQKYSIQDFWNSDYMNHIRQKMLSNQPVHECRSCKYYERNGTESYRERANARWGHRTIPEVSPVYVDLKLGNTCNLQCVFCDPNSSSKVLAEWKRLGWAKENAPFTEGIMGPIMELTNEPTDYQWVNRNNFWDNLDDISGNLQRMKFTGGEPMLNKKMFKLLEKLIEQDRAKDITLQFTTNGTVINDRIIKILNSFAEVEINFSCDGLEGTNSYIRYPLDHKKWLHNIQQFATLTNDTVKLNMQHSYGALTMLSLDQYFRWVFDQKSFGWHTFKVFRPDFMQMEVLEKHSLIQSADTLDQLILELTPRCESQRDYHLLKDIEGISNAARSAVDMTNLRPKLKKYVNDLDASRGINIYNYIPELKGHL